MCGRYKFNSKRTSEEPLVSLPPALNMTSSPMGPAGALSSDADQVGVAARTLGMVHEPSREARLPRRHLQLRLVSQTRQLRVPWLCPQTRPSSQERQTCHLPSDGVSESGCGDPFAICTNTELDCVPIISQLQRNAWDAHLQSTSRPSHSQSFPRAEMATRSTLCEKCVGGAGQGGSGPFRRSLGPMGEAHTFSFCVNKRVTCYKS